MYVDRNYRKNLAGNLETFEIKIKETDLLIGVTPGSVDNEARDKIYRYTFFLRNELEEYIQTDPVFRETLEPHLVRADAPPIARQMAQWANLVGVGPMAAVAGGFSEMVGRFIESHFSREVLVENGGDIFITSTKERVISVFAGSSPFSGRIGIRLHPAQFPLGICTSSATVGPSLSLGQADAALITARSAFLADAAATAAGNRVQTADDFSAAIDAVKKVPGVKGILLIKGDKMGLWGDLEIVPLAQEKPRT